MFRKFINNPHVSFSFKVRDLKKAFGKTGKTFIHEREHF
ncbi:hypothetical protein LEP1GSC188_4368 [Leptospira weilii serovar Topaz str. LT2116]|uniref:Uncharacterized protein n=1 Tax=Leptospira weilii serovar Topaz str. LT2116 TaxID=1088540 RepID=M3FUG2_9LEPT|nr:hypothetical protein LEP1GSC188_4368 [Leptospira weilii serovar Topaz str. LT2116]